VNFDGFNKKEQRKVKVKSNCFLRDGKFLLISFTGNGSIFIFRQAEVAKFALHLCVEMLNLFKRTIIEHIKRFSQKL